MRCFIWGFVFFCFASVYSGDSICLFKKTKSSEQLFIVDFCSIHNKTSSVQWIRPDSVNHPTSFTRLYSKEPTHNIAHKNILVSPERRMIWDLEISQDATTFQGAVRYNICMLDRNKWLAEVSLVKRIQHTETSFTDFPVITKYYTGKKSRSPIHLSTYLTLREWGGDSFGFSNINVTCEKLRE